jgi:predicted DsbA family dithiol-disulfide isomerase
MTTLRVDVWSDIACPWCYVGKRRLEAAIAKVATQGAVDVHWHAFELDPSAPRVRDTTQSYAARLASKYRTSAARAEGMLAQMTETAASEGLDFHFERAQSGNTFDAHRLVHLAAERGVQDAVKERFLRAYFTEGEAIGDPEALARLAAEAGLDAAEARAVLASDAHAEAVRSDEEAARELGITGVPFFVIGGKLGVSGAQTADVLAGALSKGFELAERSEASSPGPVCGPDGCA